MATSGSATDTYDVDLIEIVNNSNQLIVIDVQEDESSTIFQTYGQIRLMAGVSMTVEVDRVDLAALEQIHKNIPSFTIRSFTKRFIA